MEALPVAGACAGSASLCKIDRNLNSRCVSPNNSSTCQGLARNSSSYLGHTFLPKVISYSYSSKRREGRYERRTPSALLNSHEYKKQKLEKALQKEQGCGGESDSDDDLCPIECVREINTLRELEHILDHSKSVGSLVVVDFFRTSCGSCRYIEKGFQKLCKGAGNGEASVVFLKHNVCMTYPR
jgi:thiol-disulfide isomerase/thioredoxin